MPVLPEVGSIRVSPGLMRPSRLGIHDHAHADAVLHGAAGVQELALAEQFARQVAAEARQADHGRPAHGVADRVEDGRLQAWGAILPHAWRGRVSAWPRDRAGGPAAPLGAGPAATPRRVGDPGRNGSSVKATVPSCCTHAVQ